MHFKGQWTNLSFFTKIDLSFSEKSMSRASIVLKIIDSIPSVIRNAMISSWNKAPGFEPTEKQSDVYKEEDELIELDLLELERSDEQPIEVSEDGNESILPKK